jgi:beta-fructofuranosidase
MNWVNTDWDEGHKGLVYFAPESMLLPDGRRVMWTWVMGDIAPSAVQALPRELELPEDGVLRIKPLREISKLRYEEKVRNQFTVDQGSDYQIEDIHGDALELKIIFKAPLPDKFGIKLFGNGNGDKDIRIISGANRKTLGVGPIDPPFELRDGEDLTLRIFIDKNMVEVFANDRQAAVVAHEQIMSDPGIRLFSEDRDVVVKEAITWKMKPIF